MESGCKGEVSGRLYHKLPAGGNTGDSSAELLAMAAGVSLLKRLHPVISINPSFYQIKLIGQTGFFSTFGLYENAHPEDYSCRERGGKKKSLAGHESSGAPCLARSDAEKDLRREVRCSSH